MDVGRTDGVGGLGRIDGIKKPAHIAPSSQASAPSDRVEISDQARFISELLSLPSTREERIDEIRRTIESGKYDTDERLAGALEKFLQENSDLLE